MVATQENDFTIRICDTLPFNDSDGQTSHFTQIFDSQLSQIIESIGLPVLLQCVNTFLLQQILLLFIARFKIYTGNPWARICHHVPPPLSTMIRGVLGMLLAMLRGITLGRDMGFGH